MNYILSIQDLQAWQPSTVGGKGYALAAMLQIGMNVPEAFCITVDAYKAYTEQPIVKEAIHTALEEIRTQVNATQLEQIANTLRRALLEVPIPTQIADEIKIAYARLAKSTDADALPVAVRSSATAEDYPMPVLPAS